MSLTIIETFSNKNETERKRGRPRKYERLDNEPLKYYKLKGTKSSGRPRKEELSNLTALERKQHNRQLEYAYMLRRGKFIVKINYYEKKYKDFIPKTITDLPQNTNEEVLNKFALIYDFINVLKKQELLKSARGETKIIKKLIHDDMREFELEKRAI